MQPIHPEFGSFLLKQYQITFFPIFASVQLWLEPPSPFDGMSHACGNRLNATLTKPATRPNSRNCK